MRVRVCVCVYVRERVCVCVFVKQKETQSESEWLIFTAKRNIIKENVIMHYDAVGDAEQDYNYTVHEHSTTRSQKSS